MGWCDTPRRREFAADKSRNVLDISTTRPIDRVRARQFNLPDHCIYDECGVVRLLGLANSVPIEHDTYRDRVCRSKPARAVPGLPTYCGTIADAPCSDC